MAGSDLVPAGLHLLPALVWGAMAWELWRVVLGARPRGAFFWILAALTTLTGLHHVLHVLLALTPTKIGGRAPWLHTAMYAGIDVSVVFTMPLFRHLIPLLPLKGEPPSRRWLAVNYGSAVVVCAVSGLAALWTSASGGPSRLGIGTINFTYALVMGVLMMPSLARLARRGGWQRRLDEVRAADVAVFALALAALVGLALVVVWGRVPFEGSDGALLLHTATGLLLAVPFAVRMLGETVRHLLMALGLGAATLGAYLGAIALRARVPPGEAVRLVDVGAIVALVLVLVSGRAALRAAVDGLVFRRGRQRRAALQAALHELDPAAGVRSCCTRALADFARVMGVPAAAILLADGGADVVYGDFRTEPLHAVWPRGAAARTVLDRPLAPSAFRELPPPLREALAEASVLWAIPITSPAQCWGHLFVSQPPLLAAPWTSDDVDAVQAFADQLARVLDAAGLLARAVTVERSLAHAEKLAAIGETAARIAHDIRNPVTAARSLAQQLAREPGSPFAEEHRLILGELERVERRVAALLRFARREELRLEAVDLGDLAHATLTQLRPRLEADAIAAELTAAAGVVVRGDREKLRQALINLVENAADALAARPGGRRVALAVAAANGTGTLAVTDNGPGVPADALPRLFDPFFSLKESGTGLGLAIARRTVDAHGGRIDAGPVESGGMAFRIELPLAGPAA